MPYKPDDHFAKKARSESYLARSVYKLKEIQDKHQLLRKGNHILDLGASPGSWSQFASEVIGPKGQLLGIDLTEIHLCLDNAHFMVGDLNAPDWQDHLRTTPVPPPYDVVLSDMAPKTTGVKSADQARSVQLCEQALWLAEQVLRTGGHFVCKMFDNGEAPAFRQELRTKFKAAHVMRPKSTRQVSTEIFFVALGLLAPESDE